MRRAVQSGVPVLLLFVFGFAPGAGAKVVFTGYADFRVTPHSVIDFDLPPSLAASAGVTSGRSESRTAAFDSIGLFAANSLSERTEFLVDLTWRDVGFTTRTLRLQYAYLEHAAGGGLTLRAGKFMLPFGHMNEHKFYAFQQASVTQPVFLSSIVGLPISDLGVAAEESATLGPVRVRIAGYTVNGYGPVPGSKSAFRSVTLPGGLTIANNLGATDANKKPAGGGRLILSPDSRPDLEIGGSYYAGHWDPAGKRLLQMANAHLRIALGPVDLRAEYLHLHVEDDAGFRAVVGGRDWRTDGAFATFRVRTLEAFGRNLVPWARAEEYRTRGIGGTGREALRGYAAGLAWSVEENVTLKLEVNQLIYGLPFLPGEDLDLDIMSGVIGLAVSF